VPGKLDYRLPFIGAVTYRSSSRKPEKPSLKVALDHFAAGVTAVSSFARDSHPRFPGFTSDLSFDNRNENGHFPHVTFNVLTSTYELDQTMHRARCLKVHSHRMRCHLRCVAAPHGTAMRRISVNKTFVKSHFIQKQSSPVVHKQIVDCILCATTMWSMNISHKRGFVH